MRIQPRSNHRRPGRMLRSMLAHQRSGISDLWLSLMLAFVAGAINAGGFLVVGQYTSHMTGIVSGAADSLALGFLGLVGSGMIAVAAFISGAGCSAILINWGRRNVRTRQYAYPIALEALLLLAFGTVGVASRNAPAFLTLAAPLLCFIMGLQNATITKISGARTRTTHVTGMVTDIGIELGKMAVWQRVPVQAARSSVPPDTRKLALLSWVVAMFFLGGVAGALSFAHFGYLAVIPLSALLLALCAPQLILRRHGS